ncbi:MAG: hypothetical protein JWR61_4006 [Ferruginibacter sp.]|nr:hypothetical protein [Ferruginibacter sp.]
MAHFPGTGFLFLLPAEEALGGIVVSLPCTAYHCGALANVVNKQL